MFRSNGTALFLAVCATILVLNAVGQIEVHSQVAAAAATAGEDKKDENKVKQSYFAVGDSIAQGLRQIGMDGDAKEGLSSSAVLQKVQGIPADRLKGKTVILSSGASNSPNASTLRSDVEQQIQALKAKGANVILLGVGSRFAHLNGLLQQIAAENGAKFEMLTKTGTDNVHPANYNELLSSFGGNVDKDPALANQNNNPISRFANFVQQSTQQPAAGPTQPLSLSQLQPFMQAFAQQPQNVSAITPPTPAPFATFSATPQEAIETVVETPSISTALSENIGTLAIPQNTGLVQQPVPSVDQAAKSPTSNTFTSPDLAYSPTSFQGNGEREELEKLRISLGDIFTRLKALWPF